MLSIRVNHSTYSNQMGRCILPFIRGKAQQGGQDTQLGSGRVGGQSTPVTCRMNRVSMSYSLSGSGSSF
jgi:hypothetical protein